MNLDFRFIDSLLLLPWFRQCGLSHNFSFEVCQVRSWKEAIDSCASIEWENTTLEARNRLTEYLSTKWSSRYCEWNTVTLHVKAKVINPLTTKLWTPFAAQNNLPKTFVDCIEWDILAACMETEYCDCAGIPCFFQALLQVYKAGHFPCGWTSNEYPKG